MAIALLIGMHHDATGRLIAVERSPDGKERLALYRPGPLQRWLGYSAHDYAVARLSRNADGSIVATSPPFYYDGAGQIHWAADGVDVGVAARFDRATGRWSTP